MGPKDKKPKKLTKAEKEKLKKEEAEQKAKEEEEARLLAEQAELERLEQERIEAEERRLLEERERVSHQAEIDELKKQLEKNKLYLADLKKDVLQKNKWERYMLCDGRPDPTCKKDINSYINLTREDTDDLSLEKVLKTCELILKLIAELDQNIEEVTEELHELPGYNEEPKCETLLVIENEEVKSENENENEKENEIENENETIDETNNEEQIAINNLKSIIKSYQESKEDLQCLITFKIDEATHALLKSPGKNIDPDDLNIQGYQVTDNLKVCIWGNSAKNPRIKQVSYLKDPFTMELPKQMALLDIAVRLLYMNFDPYSCKSEFYFMKPPKKNVGMPVIDIEVDESSEAQNMEKSRNDMKSSLSIAASTKVTTMNALSAKDIRSKSRLGTAMSATNSTKGTSKIAVEKPSAIPSKVESMTPALDSVMDDDEDLIDDDVVDLRLFSPMGSLIYIELFQLPPQPKEVKGWIMQQVIKGGLNRIPYGPESDSQSSESIKSNASIAVKSNKSLLSVDYDQPLALSVRVDQKVMLHQDPEIARWDESTKNWKLDGITDAQYDEESGSISFRTTHFGPFAIIQDKYLSLPFTFWQLRPTGLNECVLNLISATVEVDILIKEGECCVQFPEKLEKVGHIANKWMKPAQLIEALRYVGINLFPYEDGHRYVKIYPKEEALITPVYQYIALLASCFSFMLSKWNIECGEEKVVIQALEWLGSHAPPQTHNLYYGTTRISYQLNIQEDAEEFSTDVVPNSSMHPDLYHMLRDGASESAKQRLQDTSVVYIDCVHHLLKASNILVYS